MYQDTGNDLDLDAIVQALNLATESGATAIRTRLATPLTEKAAILQRQSELRAIKPIIAANAKQIESTRQLLKTHEADVRSVANAADDKRLKDYYTQILWPQDSWFSRLNHQSWLTELTIFLRTIFLPGMAVLLPVMIFVAPFLIYTFVLKKPLSISEYVTLISTALKKAVPNMLGSAHFQGKGGVMELGEQFVRIGFGIGIMIMSVWNQISAAIHMRNIVADMRRRATAVLEFSNAIRNLGTLLRVPVDCGPAWSPGSLGVFGDAWNDPARVTKLLDECGRLDMLISAASMPRTCFPTFTSAADISAGIVIQNLYHPGLPAKQRIYNSISMQDRHHVVLTGPNRGGKSTLLKSLGSAVIMAQTLGIVCGRKASLPVFGSIITALTPADSLGKMSLFEAEIEFAKDVRRRLSEDAVTPMFLMMDEIFHGTNALDGVEASQIFLDQLYAFPNVHSIVSTHYMDLPTRYCDKQATALCMDASVDPTDTDRLIYTYKLCPGTNKHSSVREILRERGLLVPGGGAVTESKKQNIPQ